MERTRDKKDWRVPHLHPQSLVGGQGVGPHEPALHVLECVDDDGEEEFGEENVSDNHENHHQAGDVHVVIALWRLRTQHSSSAERQKEKKKHTTLRVSTVAVRKSTRHSFMYNEQNID